MESKLPVAFEVEERELFKREDELLELFKRPDKKQADYDAISAKSNEIAADWVRYVRMARSEGVAPRMKVAVKHIAVLKGALNEYEMGLQYGRVRDIGQESRTTIPLLTLNSRDLFAVNVRDGFFTPYTISREKIGEPDVNLILVSCCRNCQAKGNCDLVERCTSYNKLEYDAAIPKTLKDPAIDDYLSFEAFAKKVKVKK